MTPDDFVALDLERLRAAPPPIPPDALWARIDASRRNGKGASLQPFEVPFSSLIPDGVESDARQVTARPFVGAATLLTAAALVVWLVVRPALSLEAGMISGRLQLSPVTPRVGERIQVRYTAGALLGRPDRLVLRARVRTARAESYEAGVPVISVGHLERVTGNEYRGQFVLPDSFVYAALAVEDTAASEVDDFGGRSWEVIRAGTDGRPTLDALEQRAHDLMGRSWEEGLATARRLVALYPDSVRARAWLQAYEHWMGLVTDSTREVHLRHARRFAARDLARAMSPEELGQQFWYVRTLDSSMARSWRARLKRDAPASGLAVQEELIDIERDVAAGGLDSSGAVQRLDALWPRVPPDRRGQIGSAALSLLGDHPSRAADRLRWVDRLYRADTTESGRRRLAQMQMAVAGGSADGMSRLRTLLAQSALGTAYRRLGESQRTFRRRLAGEHARSLAALGEALLANGQFGAARDTLQLAASLVWSPFTYRSLAKAHLAMNDSIAAARAWAHVLVDPRTDGAVIDSLTRIGSRLLGNVDWAAAQSSARRVLGTQLASRAIRRVVGDVSVATLEGHRTPLHSLSQGRGLVVVFWSPLCGPAVDALPDIEALRGKLAKQGVPLVIVAEQSSVTPELTRILTTQRIQTPVYLDVEGVAAARFNNWGTPTLFLLDGSGRVMFPGTADAQEALFFSAAFNAEGKSPSS